MPDITMCTGGECSKKDTCALALVPSRSLEQIDIDELALEKRLIARLNNPAAEASS